MVIYRKIHHHCRAASQPRVRTGTALEHATPRHAGTPGAPSKLQQSRVRGIRIPSPLRKSRDSCSPYYFLTPRPTLSLSLSPLFFAQHDRDLPRWPAAASLLPPHQRWPPSPSHCGIARAPSFAGRRPLLLAASSSLRLSGRRPWRCATPLAGSATLAGPLLGHGLRRHLRVAGSSGRAPFPSLPLYHPSLWRHPEQGKQGQVEATQRRDPGTEAEARAAARATAADPRSPPVPPPSSPVSARLLILPAPPSPLRPASSRTASSGQRACRVGRRRSNARETVPLPARRSSLHLSPRRGRLRSSSALPGVDGGARARLLLPRQTAAFERARARWQAPRTGARGRVGPEAR
ncbi:hypothetical protein PVAP13_6NG179100 [Panicum virgatum]|uniref:Uncharacterized protein n=1 Tax=Panicum virgatum TaxID=38727 RepID=A0A8T0QYU1_PANVG|nr:hypothetical protein PVAP13_6NG179100 [Panicum virgatum]